ncbi:MAG: hypothetical protein ACTSXP_19735 [Promethearchaeota archaeon]
MSKQKSSKRSKNHKNKQLTLDHFSNELKQIHQDMKRGKIDPLIPLREYIKTFDDIIEKNVDDLPKYINTFSTLCNIFELKIENFKAILSGFDKNKIRRFFEKEGKIEDIIDVVPWVMPFQLVKVSGKLLDYVKNKLFQEENDAGSVAIEIEKLDTEKLPANFQLALEERLFSQEKETVWQLIKNEFPCSKKFKLNEMFNLLVKKIKIEPLKLFIIMLHLIQEGNLSIKPGGNSENIKYLSINKEA